MARLILVILGLMILGDTSDHGPIESAQKAEQLVASTTRKPAFTVEQYCNQQRHIPVVLSFTSMTTRLNEAASREKLQSFDQQSLLVWYTVCRPRLNFRLGQKIKALVEDQLNLQQEP